MRRTALGLGGAAFGIGAVSLAWAHFDWPLKLFVRGSLGDVAAGLGLVALFAALAPRARPLVWFVAAGAIAVALEVGQALGLRGRGLLGELTIGSTFDPYDLVAYAVGLAIAAIALAFGARFGKSKASARSGLPAREKARIA